MKASEWKRVFDNNFHEVEIPGTVRSNVRDCVADLEASESRIKELEADRDRLVETVAHYGKKNQEYIGVGERAEKAESSLEALRSGLEAAGDALFHAWQGFSAICETDTSVDRRKMRDSAAGAMKAARALLVSIAEEHIPGRLTKGVDIAGPGEAQGVRR